MLFVELRKRLAGDSFDNLATESVTCSVVAMFLNLERVCLLSAIQRSDDFIYSDGVIEATDKAEEMYQTERLMEVLQDE